MLYDRIGATYTRFRRADPRIASYVVDALADARTIVNVGAGAGAYEPADRDVVAVEPSMTMIAQRGGDAASVVCASAELLPFADDAFDAALASLTIHHWSDPQQGLREMARVAPRRVVVGFDPSAVADFWLVRDYMPEAADWVLRNPTTEWVCSELGGSIQIVHVPVPSDCVDGFFSAYWNRPEIYLNEDARASISVFGIMPRDVVRRAIDALARDLRSGEWDRKYGHLREESKAELGHRIIISVE